MPKSHGHGFVLSVGETAHCRSLKEAKEFRKSHGEIIEKMIRFPNKLEFDKHQKLSELTVTPEKAKQIAKTDGETTSELTDAEQRLLQSIKRSMDSNRPADKMEFYFKVTAMSSVAVIIIRFKNVEGKDDWRMKPKLLQEAPTNCHDHIPCDDSFVQDFIAGFFLWEQIHSQQA